VANETDARPDDMAVCLLSIDGGADQPAPLTEQLELDRKAATGDRPRRFLLACGVGANRIDELMAATQAQIEQAGAVLLEAHLGGASPEVALVPQNVASLGAAQARRAASVGAAS
jgi:hypothetical protein